MRRRKVPRGTRVLFFICCIAILIVVPGVYFWRRRECSETKEIFVRATVAIAVIAGSFAYFMAGVAPALFWTVPVGGILGARTARFFLKKMTGPSTGLAWLDLATHRIRCALLGAACGLLCALGVHSVPSLVVWSGEFITIGAGVGLAVGAA